MRSHGQTRRDARPDRPKTVTGEWLFRAAARYLERYASSTENLRRVLKRKVERRAATHDEQPGEETRSAHAGLIEETIAKFVDLKLVDDRSFAEAKLRNLRRSGTSGRQAAARLGQKGVDRDTIDAVIAGDETSDLAAAHRYARRRRLGPHRLGDQAERRERDVAAMMRAGFSFTDAKAAVDGAPMDDE